MNEEKILIDNELEKKKAEELVKKYDTESRYRNKLTGWRSKLIFIWLVAMSLFQLYSNTFSLMTTNIQRTYHLGFTMFAVFLLYPARKNSPQDRFSIFDMILAILSLVINGYLIFNFDKIVQRGAKVTSLEYVLGIIAILLVLEAGRRVLGKGLPILATVFLLYCYFGKYAPGLFVHR